VKDSQRRHIKKNESIKVYSDENYCVVIPKTHKAAEIYSKGTLWCTRAEHSFQAYDFPLFIIIDKNQKDGDGRQIKHQLHFETEGFKNEVCEDVDFSGYLQDKPELKDLFLGLINNNVYKKYRDIETWLSLEFMNEKVILETPCEFL